MNKILLNEKYKNLILPDKEKFLSDIDYIRSKISFSELNNLPLLVYNRNKKHALYYTLCMFFSLKKETILSYAVITGQTLIDQHFLSDDNKDIKLRDAIYYADVTFVALNQFDYTNEYLETLILDLIEFRNSNSKITIVSYDILDSTKSTVSSLTQKLHAYFLANSYQILNLSKDNLNINFTKESSTKKTKNGGRIE